MRWMEVSGYRRMGEVKWLYSPKAKPKCPSSLWLYLAFSMVRRIRWFTRDSRGVPFTLSSTAAKSTVPGWPFFSSLQGMESLSKSS